MDKKIQNLLNKWLENNLISDSTYENIVNFENNFNYPPNFITLSHSSKCLILWLIKIVVILICFK